MSTVVENEELFHKTNPEAAAAKQKELNERLIDAVWARDYPLVKRLVMAGADVTYQQSAVLIQVAYVNNMEMVEYFVDAGCSVREHDSSALRKAIENKNHEMVDYLLANDAPLCTGASVEAVRTKDLAMVKKIIVSKELICCSTVYFAATNGPLEVLKHVLSFEPDHSKWVRWLFQALNHWTVVDKEILKFVVSYVPQIDDGQIICLILNQDDESISRCALSKIAKLRYSELLSVYNDAPLANRHFLLKRLLSMHRMKNWTIAGLAINVATSDEPDLASLQLLADYGAAYVDVPNISINAKNVLDGKVNVYLPECEGDIVNNVNINNKNNTR